jgi:Mg2+ and Co2+ transporter CorA
MADSIDDIYTTILFLSDQIAKTPANDTQRKRLERKRERLRSQAAALATKGRHPRSVELEIEAIERRLEEIDALLIKEGYMERRSGKNIQDPGAYSSTINHLLTKQHAQEVEHLTEKLGHLRRMVTDGTDPAPPS